MEMPGQSLSKVSVLAPLGLVPGAPGRGTWLSPHAAPRGRVPFARPGAGPCSPLSCPSSAAPCPAEFAPGATEPAQPAGIPGRTPSRPHVDWGGGLRLPGCNPAPAKRSSMLSTPGATPGAGPGGTHPSRRSCGRRSPSPGPPGKRNSPAVKGGPGAPPTPAPLVLPSLQDLIYAMAGGSTSSSLQRAWGPAPRLHPPS